MLKLEIKIDDNRVESDGKYPLPNIYHAVDKALYFDIRIKELEKHYSATNPKGAYRRIKSFMSQHNFSHEQYSGYHSQYKTTDLEIFDLVREMSESFPWLQFCMNHFEVTNVGTNHDLMELFKEEIEDPESL